MIATDTKIIVVGAAIAVVAAWYMSGKLPEMATALPGAVVDTVGGLVIGAGDVLGIPRTEINECQRALAEGRILDASFACPAGTFLGGAWDYLTK